MPTQSEHDDFHGNVPDTAETCLLVIDRINKFAFPGGEGMCESALVAATRIAQLKHRAPSPRPCLNVIPSFEF